MAGRHIKDLIAAYRDRDDLAFRRAASAIIEEEEAKKHTALARDLRKLLASGSSSVSVPVTLATYVEPPRDRDSNVALAESRQPEVLGLNDLVLADDLRAALETLVAEVPLWPLLDVAGVPRRRRVLLYGPPGNGKSTIAEALAADLGWPLFVARVDSLMSSYLGETASNLRSLFDFAASTPAVVLLDEFDSLGKLRDDPSDHGELRRVVNATLQIIEEYRGRSLVIAATNAPAILDSALWRRFDEVFEVPPPAPNQTATLLGRLLQQSFDTVTLAPAAQRLEGLPFAAVEHAANGARRNALLHGREDTTYEDLQRAVERTLGRPWK
ncbi:MAG: ATP-binding protein [Demequina sp.]|nr:ATP-binding protein [Demequina sp.]